MSPETTITLSLAIPLISIVLSFLVFKKGFKDDIEKRAEERGKSNEKLDNIARGIDDIKIEYKAITRSLEKVTERLVKVEESTKSAHRRLDELTDK